MGFIESKLPSIKKKVSSFLTDEEGKITRESLSVLGSVAGAVALGTLMLSISEVHAQHTNYIEIDYDEGTGLISGTHTNFGADTTTTTHSSA